MKKKEYLYRICNICISLEIELKNLSCYEIYSSEKIDSYIKIKKLNTILVDGDLKKIESGYIEHGVSPVACFDGKKTIINFKDIGYVIIPDKPYEVIIYINPLKEQSIIEDILVNDIIPLILVKNGYLVLHAGCVSIDTKNILILGQSGAGKSTFIGKLFSLGHEFISDDIVVINTDNFYCLAEGYLQHISLWEKSSEYLKLENKYEKNKLKNNKRNYIIQNKSKIIKEINKIILLNRNKSQDTKIIKETKMFFYIMLLKSVIMGYALNETEWLIVQNKIRKIIDNNDLEIYNYPNDFKCFDNVVKEFIKIMQTE